MGQVHCVAVRKQVHKEFIVNVKNHERENLL
jgi:hypothetical protein